MDEHSASDWKKDSQSFDAVAAIYDKFRPAYPQKLIAHIIKLIGLPEGGKILEIGSGTGKATRLFARRGYSILCVEPGANLAAVAAQNLQTFPRVSFEIARFEQAQEHPDEFDLVMSAQAFHWISKDIGYVKAAHALKTGGHLALFWNMNPVFQGQIDDDLERIYLETVPELGNRPKNDNEEIIQERSSDITGSGCFGPVTIRRFPWSKTYRTKEYIGLLNTYSDHLRLSEQTRQRLFEGIAGVIDSHGGSIRKKYVSVLYVAKKLL
jgi:SAM-dependent methyltransferase